MLFNDIQDLLDDVRFEIEQAKQNQIISKVKLKNVFENLRSILEYSAQDINRRLSVPKNKIYFPYAETEQDFFISINKNFNNLEKEHPEIYQLVESLQPHKLNDNWLCLMCQLTNTAKHNRSLDIEKIEEQKKIKSISAGNLIKIEGSCNNVRVSNIFYNGKSFPDFIYKDNKLEITKTGDLELKIDFEILSNNRLIIRDIKYDLFDFVEKCLNQINTYINSLYQFHLIK